MPTRPPKQPYDGTEMMVISMDIGTTQSTVSFVHLIPGSLSQPIWTVDYWPGQMQSKTAGMIPTVMFYRAGVMWACGEEAIQYLKRDDPNVAQLFKLHIHPSTMERPSDFAIPPMPPGVSVERAYGNMMRYMMNCTRVFFETNTPNGNAIWARLRDNMVIILVTPNGWGHLEQATMRTAGLRAGITTPENAERVIRFVTEAEAAFHYAQEHYLRKWLDVDTDLYVVDAEDPLVLVVDAGGSCVDIAVYKRVSTRPLRMREVCSKSIQAGGIFVNQEVKRLLSGQLRGSSYDDPVVIETMLDYFENELKPTFDGSQSSYQISFGDSTDTDPRLGISKGKITISTEKLKGAFDNVVNQIIACCTNALGDYTVEWIFLAGGFGRSPYLGQALEKEFAIRGASVILANDYLRRATTEGATIGWIEGYVKARAARATIGGCVRELYDRELHGEREHCAYIDTDGKKRVNNVFHLWVNKGTVLQEDEPHRLHYHSSQRVSSTTKGELASQLGKMVTEVYVWEGNGPIPRWCKDEDGRVAHGMTHMCTLDADLSPLASSLKITGKGNKMFYRAEYDVCVYLGGTSLRASLEWRDENDVHRAPVTVIDVGLGNISASDDIAIDKIHAAEQLALICYERGQCSEAEKAQMDVIEWRSQMFHPEHSSVITANATLALIYSEQNLWLEAEKIQVRVLEQRNRIQGIDHPQAIRATRSLADTYTEQGKYQEAENLQTEVLDQYRRTLGENHPDTIKAVASLADTFHIQGRWDEACRLKLEVFERRRETLGGGHSKTVLAAESLSATRQMQQELELTGKLEQKGFGILRGLALVDLGSKLKEMGMFVSDAAFVTHAQASGLRGGDLGPYLNWQGSSLDITLQSWVVKEHFSHWYHQATNRPSHQQREQTGYSYRISLVALNLDIPETSIMVDESSTFEEIGLSFYSSTASSLPVALEQLDGPNPRWRIPSTNAKIPRGLQRIYIVDITVPSTLALCRDIREDIPLLIPIASPDPANSTTVEQTVLRSLQKESTSPTLIRLFASPENIQNSPFEQIQRIIQHVFTTELVVILNNDPSAYKFRNVQDITAPLPLRLAFLQCLRLVTIASHQKGFELPMIHLSRSLLHLIICLAEAISQASVEELVALVLISRLKSSVITLKGLFEDVEGSTDSRSYLKKAMIKFFHELCREQPGVVAVRQSFDIFNEFIAEIQDSSRGTGQNVPHEDENHDIDYSATPDGGPMTEGSSDSLSTSEGESTK